MQAAAKAFLAALQRGKRSKPGLFDVMAFYIGRVPCDELGEPVPADHACWTDRGWLEKGRRYYVDVLGQSGLSCPGRGGGMVHAAADTEGSAGGRVKEWSEDRKAKVEGAGMIPVWSTEIGSSGN